MTITWKRLKISLERDMLIKHWNIIVDIGKKVFAYLNDVLKKKDISLCDVDYNFLNGFDTYFIFFNIYVVCNNIKFSQLCNHWIFKEVQSDFY